ncbi:hypothetical protein EC9_48980 [Rosistilla ulvae]|uniref:Uncharacterized protein n=1 Tax=Rosistilla ulvae TaxID=1930277 RepID=A0A517M725_9BACT|nr:hypothetical protein EC9_48980 [Rosistilla ulvae]
MSSGGASIACWMWMVGINLAGNCACPRLALSQSPSPQVGQFYVSPGQRPGDANAVRGNKAPTGRPYIALRLRRNDGARSL